LKEKETELYQLRNELRNSQGKIQSGEDKLLEAENEIQELTRVKGEIFISHCLDEIIEVLKTKNSKLKAAIKELSKNGEEANNFLSKELSNTKNKLRDLEDKLKDEKYSFKEVEKENKILKNTNSQMIKDYKQDLETLKEGMRVKSKDDEALFKRVLDEKGSD